MENIQFSFLGVDISLIQIAFSALFLIVYLFILNRIITKKKDDYFDSKNINAIEKRIFRVRAFIFITMLLILAIQKIFKMNMELWVFNDQSLNLSLIIEGLTIISFAITADWLISNVYIKNYFSRRTHAEKTSTFVEPQMEEKSEKKATRLVQWVVYLYGIRVLISRFGMDLVLIHQEIKGEIFNIKISDIILSILIIVFSRLIVWILTNVTLYKIYKRKGVDEGTQYAINQLITYVIYVVAVMVALEHLVSDMKIFYGGAAALLVGVGLGLQQTFNDLFSGIVLLLEQSVKVGDIVEMEGKVGRVLRIGIRSSLIETRQSVSLLVPNSKLVNQYVLNWTHNNDVVRFDVNVGVAYGSDTSLVKRLLLKSIDAEPRILKTPEAFIRFNNFGDSSLDFTVYFFSLNAMNIEDLKSNLRFEIDRLFRENNVSIPFPQRDVWMK